MSCRSGMSDIPVIKANPADVRFQLTPKVGRPTGI